MAVLLLTPCCPLFFHPPLRYPDPSRPRGAFLSLLLCRSAREWPFKINDRVKGMTLEEGGRTGTADPGLRITPGWIKRRDDRRGPDETSVYGVVTERFCLFVAEGSAAAALFPLLASPVCLVFSAVNSFKNHVTSLHWVNFFFFVCLISGCCSESNSTFFTSHAKLNNWLNHRNLIPHFFNIFSINTQGLKRLGNNI